MSQVALVFNSSNSNEALSKALHLRLKLLTVFFQLFIKLPKTGLIFYYYCLTLNFRSKNYIEIPNTLVSKTKHFHAPRHLLGISNVKKTILVVLPSFGQKLIEPVETTQETTHLVFLRKSFHIVSTYTAHGYLRENY